MSLPRYSQRQEDLDTTVWQYVKYCYYRVAVIRKHRRLASMHQVMRAGFYLFMLIIPGCRPFSAQIVATGSRGASRDLRSNPEHCRYGRRDKVGSTH